MKAFFAACVAIGMLLAAEARAEPAADAIKKAAGAFDDGSRAYKAKQYELAASYFEAADAAVPSPRALRMAIRARTEAKQPARASTLSELALARHHDDEATHVLAKKTIAANAASLHRLQVKCTSACVLSVGTRSVPGSAAKRWVLWVPPGDTRLGASFADDRGAEQQTITAKAGGKNNLTFIANMPKPAPVVPDPARPTPTGPDPQPPVTSEPPPRDPDEGDGESSWVEHPAVFVVGLVATAGVGGVLVWSGIDALQNPGQDGVREACVGQGTDCPEYQRGLDAQLRTNILIGATAGLGVITGIIGIFVTDWGGDDDADVSFVVTPDRSAISFSQRF